MKPAFEQIDTPLHHSFNVREISVPAFDAPYHQHPEIELTLIMQSRGKRFVGTHLTDYGPGDLVLLGSNLPHCWRSNERDPEPARAVVIQFKPLFLGETFWQTPELAGIAALLARAQAGLHVGGSTAGRIARHMQNLPKAAPFNRLAGLLSLLHDLAHSPDLTPLGAGQPTAFSAADCERIAKIYGYVAGHFRDPIRLDEAAQLVSMTPQAFCRYFKKTTRRTFVELVNDYRIRHASQLLTDHRERSVAEVCFESGFGHISHFNKQFRLATGYSPVQYRRAFLATPG